MEQESLLGMFMGFISIVGGFSIAAFAIHSGYRRKMAEMDIISRERLAMIEKGLPLPAQSSVAKPSRLNAALFWGLLLSGLGLGIFVGYSIVQVTGQGHDDNIIDGSAILFAGIGLIIFYIIRSRNEKQAA